MDLFSSIGQFNAVFKVPKTRPADINYKDLQLAISVIQEEVNELTAAAEVMDEVSIFDALVDIIYVTTQQADRMGFPLREGFDEVHSSNMSKLDDNGEPIFREDGKVLKGSNFVPPNLKDVLEVFAR